MFNLMEQWTKPYSGLSVKLCGGPVMSCLPWDHWSADVDRDPSSEWQYRTGDVSGRCARVPDEREPCLEMCTDLCSSCTHGQIPAAEYNIR